MRHLYRVIQNEFLNIYNEMGEDMLKTNKIELLNHVIREVLFEIDARDYSFNDIFVSFHAASNIVFDDFSYSDTDIIRALNPAYCENIINLTNERK